MKPANDADLPPALRQLAEHLRLPFEAERERLYSMFLERLADAKTSQDKLDLVTGLCFDYFAFRVRMAEPVLSFPDAEMMWPKYESYLLTAEEETLRILRDVMGEYPQKEREAFIVRIEAKLTARRFEQLAKARDSYHDRGPSPSVTAFIAEAQQRAPYATATSVPVGQSEEVLTIATWPEIEIWFLGEHRVEIKVQGKCLTYNFGEMGFEDRRTKNPNGAWVLLRELAKNQGVLRNFVSPEKVTKHVQNIRRLLRALLARNHRLKFVEDPVPYVDGTGYRTSFTIGCRQSFYT